MYWRHLNSSPCEDTNSPTLLLASNISSSSYRIYITDLTTVWSESLSYLEIRKRSYEENTSIDPSSEDQFAILLDKIDQAVNGRPGTALKLRVNGKKTTLGIRDLILQLHVDMPQRLTAFEWPVQLSAGSPALLTEAMTIPLLRAYRQSLGNLDFLSQSLKLKDIIVEKLIDKLEEYGIDLGLVFPQILGKQRGKVDRECAMKKVRGLAKFDIKSLKTFHGLDNSTENIGCLIKNLFKDEKNNAISFEIKNCLDRKEHWWESMLESSIDLRTEFIATKDSLQEVEMAQTSFRHLHDGFSDSRDERTSRNQTKSDIFFRDLPSTTSTILGNNETIFFNKKCSKLEAEIEMTDSEVESDNAFSPLPGSSKKSEEFKGTKLEPEPLSLPLSYEKLSTHEVKPITSLSNSIQPIERKGKLMVLKGRKIGRMPSKDSVTEDNTALKAQDKKVLSTVPLISASSMKKNLGIIKGTKEKKGIKRLPSLDPFDSKLCCEKQQNIQKNNNGNSNNQTNSLESFSPDIKKPPENIGVKEDPLEKANRKRAELRKEIEIKMASNAPAKKTRYF